MLIRGNHIHTPMYMCTHMCTQTRCMCTDMWTHYIRVHTECCIYMQTLHMQTYICRTHHIHMHTFYTRVHTQNTCISVYTCIPQKICIHITQTFKKMAFWTFNSIRLHCLYGVTKTSGVYFSPPLWLCSGEFWEVDRVTVDSTPAP